MNPELGTPSPMYSAQWFETFAATVHLPDAIGELARRAGLEPGAAMLWWDAASRPSPQAPRLPTAVQATRMTVLSVDLASRRYRDNGIAVLRRSVRGIDTELISSDALGLTGAPEADRLAAALARLAAEHGAHVILLDGPQGWRAEVSDLVHQRGCERATRTPGKTGTPRTVKPRSWTRMAEFSIAVFDALTARGWPRLSASARGPVAVESFPTHGWRMIGFRPLPGKTRCPRDLRPWTAFLTAQHGLQWCKQPTHDELQAVVAGIGGLQLVEQGLANCDVRGTDPASRRGCGVRGSS